MSSANIYILAKDPGLEPLFNDIAGFIQELTIRDESTQVNGFEAFSSKKRKVQGLQYHDSSDAQFSNLEWPSGSFVSVKDLSFSIPQRKKFTLEIGKNKTQGLLIKHPANNDIEFSIKWELVGENLHKHLLTHNVLSLPSLYAGLDRNA